MVPVIEAAQGENLTSLWKQGIKEVPLFSVFLDALVVELVDTYV